MITALPQNLLKKITRLIAQCSKDWDLIEPHDRIMVAYSGGKDSALLVYFLSHIQTVVPFDFSFEIFHLNQSYPDFPARGALDFWQARGIAVHSQDLAMKQILEEKIAPEQSPCGLCSRLRRGILYTQAQRMGFNKIALGHHRDDSIETLLMNALYAGTLKAMPAKLVSDDKMNTIIRPMLYVPESLLIDAAQALQISTVKATFCTREHSGQRAQTKALLDSLEALNPKVRGNLLAALHHVVPSHLLDKTLLKAE